MTEKDLPALSIADLQSLLRRREVSAREAIDAKLSMEKLALICRWTLMLRLKKRTRRMSIFHWAASRLRLKTSSM